MGRITVHAQKDRGVFGNTEAFPSLFSGYPFCWKKGNRRKNIYGLGEALLALESPPLSARRKDPVRLGIQHLDITTLQRFLRLKEIDPDTGRTGSLAQNVRHVGRISHEKEEVGLLCLCFDRDHLKPGTGGKHTYQSLKKGGGGVLALEAEADARRRARKVRIGHASFVFTV
jgi:hypothetical protein